MPPPSQRYYDIKKLMMIFAVSAVLLVMAIGAMINKDYARTWKDYQNDFRLLEIEKARVGLDIEQSRLSEDSGYQELEGQIKAARQSYEETCVSSEETDAKLDEMRTKEAILDKDYRKSKAFYDEAKYHLEEALDHKSADLPAVQKHFDEIAGRMLAQNDELQELRYQISELEGVQESCGAELAELERRERQFTMQSGILQRKLDRIDPNEMSMTNRIANLIRDLPVIDMSNPNNKIRQVVLKDLPQDMIFAELPRVDRCTTCHLGIDDPVYKNAPQPFTTHPNLDLFMAKDSAHPLEEFGCTVCHAGRGRGTDFTSSAHTPTSEEDAGEWEKRYHWEPLHHWDDPMLPVDNTQASCFKCHSGNTSIPGAEKLNLGLTLIEKAGCYACHFIDHYKNWPKPGPDLRHLASKTSKNWVYHWIRDPHSFRHNTWMPAFFGLSNNDDPASVARSEQEIHAIVQYLFDKSSNYEMENLPHWGNADKGEEIVASFGCLGCHTDQPEPTGQATTLKTLLREQGPNLSGSGTKTTKAWLYHWLRDPQRYHPETLMPNLRLSEEEAADAAAYLAEQKNDGFMQSVLPAVDSGILDEIIRDFIKNSLTEEEIGAKLDGMTRGDKLLFAGEKLIGHYGCYSCHAIEGFETIKPIGTELTEEGSKDVHRLDFGFIDIPHTRQDWFAQKLRDPRRFDRDKVKEPLEKLRMPNYNFSDDEISAITTAILGFVKEHPGKRPADTPQNQYIADGEELVRMFNCRGCHEMTGLGGAIQDEVVNWMVKYQNRGESEAQALVHSFSPPNLIGEGQKVQTDWLFHFLHEVKPIRPWLAVRMPTYPFSVDHLNTLVKYFSALDGEPMPFSQAGELVVTKEFYEAGAKLFSKDYFNCTQCHIVGKTMPSGSPENWAPDFALSGTRLKPEWLIQWITNPQALLPGTKMPTYFDPQSFDASGPDDILDGDENQQIQALRDYLWTLSPAHDAPAGVSSIPVSAPADPASTAAE